MSESDEAQQTDIDWDNLPPSTMPPNLPLSVQGFTNTEAAEKLAHTVGGYIGLIGRFIDVSSLDAVTIAIDYDAALAGLDRGIEGLRPLSRSNSDEIQGVAISSAVLRDGVVKTHLIFNAANVVALIADEATPEDVTTSVGIVAHECAHVQITTQKEAAIPDARFGGRIEGYERAVCFQMAEVCWDEYAACRISAPFAAGQNAQHAQSLISVVANARETANSAIKAYRTHADINQLVAEAGASLCQPMKVAAYLLGGMDGDGIGWAEMSDARQAVEAAGYAQLIDQLHERLIALWESQGEWDPSLDVFAPLMALAKSVFASGGIHFGTNAEGGCRIDVPFTPATMPGLWGLVANLIDRPA
jgi:hypothetical protein